ncbi:MAG TPA: GldM family protein [Bacteroidia bacterium]|nr:GldM family protein [Bacteroidia bacterium]
MKKTLNALKNFAFAILLVMTTDTSVVVAQNNPVKLSSAAQVGNKHSGNIDKNELIEAGKLTLNEQYNTTYAIRSFRITLVRFQQQPVELSNESGGEFTPEMIELIKSAESGNKIYFEYIKCSNLDNSTMLSLSALSFIIN